jgi:hypothetical protein
MDIELNDSSDLKDAYQGKYKGDDVHLRRISNEVRALRGEYAGFGTYLKRLSAEAMTKKTKLSTKPVSTIKVAFSLATLAAVGIGLFLYFGKAKKNERARSIFNS